MTFLRRRNVTLILLAAGITLAGCQEPPAANNKTVAEWIDQAKQKDLTLREEAIAGLVACGPEASPWLIAELQGDDPETIFPCARALLQLKQEQSVFIAFDETDGEQRMAIAAACCRENVGVDVALPLAVLTLGGLPEERRGAVAVFENVQPESRAAVPVILDALENPDPEVRWRAAHTAGRLKPFAAQLVPACGKAVTDTDVRVRRAAARALEAFGDDALSARAALETAQDDSDPEVRNRVAAILKQLPN